MTRVARPLLLALLVVGLVVPGVAASAIGAGAPGTMPAAPTEPKVVVIVGPVGDRTEHYRDIARETAREARRWTSRVTTVFSPDATWPAVRAALTDASLVVYLGHGNGWPSRYRDALHPATQNGFGLNPEAGRGDDAHQYFGEAFVDDVRLAPGALVILSHLCYASGNTEPGLPEGSLEDANRRVDNFAAGFLRAGASAVLAEAYLSPAWYVRRVLGGDGSIEGIWQSAPSFHDHVRSLSSERTPGAVLRLDPDRPDGGHYRSLVTLGTPTAGGLRTSATGSASGDQVLVSAPSIAALGIGFASPRFDTTRPAAAGSTRLFLPLSAGHPHDLPRGTQVGLRWERLESAVPDLPPGPVPVDPPPIALVAPEEPATLVEPVRAGLGNGRLIVPLTFPTAPGRYRLTITLHDAEGVAFDAPSQAGIAPLAVRVGGPHSFAISTPDRVGTAPGSALEVPVRLANTGTVAWGETRPLDTPDPEAPTPDDESDLDSAAVADIDGVDDESSATPAATLPPATSYRPAMLVATWVATGEDPAAVPGPVMLPIDAAVAAGEQQAIIRVPLVAPEAPGTYLLLLDVVDPVAGSLVARGSEPGLVRVVVGT